MRRIILLGAVAPLLLTACTPAVYEERAKALQTSLGGLKSARATFAARPALSGKEASGLASGNPIQVGEACMTASRAAQREAANAVSRGQTLDSLYQGGGAMAHPSRCVVSVLKTEIERVAEEDRQRPAPPAPAAPAAFDQAIAEDERLCRTLRNLPTPDAIAPGAIAPLRPAAGAGSPRAPDLTASRQLWAGVQAYVDGLAELTSADESARLGEATGGASGALKDLADKAKAGPAGLAVDFLFKVLDAAVEQKRYQALRASVVCGDGLLLKWRGVMKDALRYEQLAAYDARSTVVLDYVADLQGIYDDDPDGHCAGDTTSTLAALASRNCNVEAARRALKANVLSSPPKPGEAGVTLDQRFAAVSFLHGRAEEAGPRIAEAKAEADAANAIAAADPGPAVDAFIAAHRALRDDVVAGKGQGPGLKARFKELYEAGDALRKALKPAETTDEGEA